AVLCMGLGFVLERALSGYAIAAFPLAKNTGLAHTFATGADRTAVRRALLVLCALAAAGMAAAGGMTGAAMALAAVLVFLRYRAVAQKQFGGISGDLAGWFLQKAELWMLAALAACSLLSGVTG
ncbi:MAG: adenosylcobinamide-GDP ribazoletransferase, partial [Ruthenibacterium lactatiformans]